MIHVLKLVSHVSSHVTLTEISESEYATLFSMPASSGALWCVVRNKTGLEVSLMLLAGYLGLDQLPNLG